MTNTRSLIESALSANGLSVESEKTALLAAYLDELLRVNEHMNLTAVRDPRDAAV